MIGLTFTLPAYANLSIVPLSGIVRIIINIVIGAVLVGIGLQSLKIDEMVVEGIVVIVLAIIIGSTLALIGGILILIGGLLE